MVADKSGIWSKNGGGWVVGEAYGSERWYAEPLPYTIMQATGFVFHLRRFGRDLSKLLITVRPWSKSRSLKQLT